MTVVLHFLYLANYMFFVLDQGISVYNKNSIIISQFGESICINVLAVHIPKHAHAFTHQ